MMGFAVVPYVHGVTEPIKRILGSYNIKVAQKPFLTLNHIFSKPKDPVSKEQKSDAIYSMFMELRNLSREFWVVTKTLSGSLAHQ